MKTLMLNYEFPPIGGGAGKAHLSLLKEYAGNDELQVDVLTSAPKPGFTIERFAGNVTIYKVGVHKKNLHYWRKTEVLEWLFKAWFHYRRLLKSNNYDLAHAFFGFPSGLFCRISAKKLPYIISLRGSDVPGLNPRLSLDYKILAPVFRWIWRKADYLVACSSGLRDRALRFLPTVDIEVIPNGVDLHKFKPISRKHKPDSLRLLTVGRLSITKRIELLISAVALAHQRFPGITLTVAGDGCQKPELKWLPAQLGVGDRVSFIGQVPAEQMPQAYQQHDVFVSTTAQEGMSNAMLEAMASGLPIVTTRCEGVEELITDNGIVVEKVWAEEIAEAIKTLMEDRQAYRRMSIAARKQAKRFSWHNVADRYMRCYDRLRQKNLRQSVG